jgi:hypothetical protein
VAPARSLGKPRPKPTWAGKADIDLERVVVPTPANAGSERLTRPFAELGEDRATALSRLAPARSIGKAQA